MLPRTRESEDVNECWSGMSARFRLEKRQGSVQPRAGKDYIIDARAKLLYMRNSQSMRRISQTRRRAVGNPPSRGRLLSKGGRDGLARTLNHA